jgi:6-phosphogluconolactonase
MKELRLRPLCILLALTITLSFQEIGHAQKKKEILYAGTFSVRDSKGIYVYQFDAAKGKLTPIQTITDRESPTFLAVHPSGKYLYAVNRMAVDADHAETGSVSAYSIDPTNGKLTFVNHVSSYGKGPCHITIDQTGTLAFISNYHEGNLVIYRILGDGSLGAVTDSKKYSGEKASHIHFSLLSPDNKFLFVTDLGTDKIYSYALDVVNGKISPTSQEEISVAPGAGPRHLTFHPNGKNIYLAEELTSTVGVFSYNSKTGGLKLLQDTIRSLPRDFKEKNSSADIHTDPKGKFLYQSNRGLDALAIYSIQPNGSIRLNGYQPTGGKVPRNFNFSSNGTFLLVANQDTDNIIVFKQDPKTGKLTKTRNEVKIPSPVCLKFLKLK